MRLSTKVCNEFYTKALRLFIIMVASLMFPCFINAQAIDIKGKVYDSKSKTQLMGATVKIKGVRMHKNNVTAMATDKEGGFALKANQLPVTLVVSMVGFKTQEIDMYEATPAEVFLVEERNILGEVNVVAALGKKKEIEMFLDVPETAPGIEIIHAAKIEELRPKDLYDLFQTSLGLTISRQGSRVNNWVSGRGAGNSSMGIIIDGAYITQTEAQRILGEIPMEAIESVQIVRDASLVTMGPVSSGSLGSPNQGYIIITTKQNFQESGTDLMLSYGSYNQIKGGVYVAKKINDNFRFSVGYNKSRNESKTDKWGDWHNAADGNMFMGNAIYNSDFAIVKLSFFYNQTQRDIQRYQEADGTWGTAVWTYDPRNTIHSVADVILPWNDHNKTEISFGYSNAEGDAHYNTAERTDLDLENVTLVAPRHFQDRATTLNALHVMNYGRNTLKVGGQLIYEYKLSEGAATYSSEYKVGMYASDQYNLSDNMILDAGFRYDKVYVGEGTEKYTADGVTTKNKSNMWGNDAYTGSVGAKWTPGKMANVSARISYTSVPTPTTLSTVDNKELPDAKWMKYEVGPVFNLHPALTLSVTGYYYTIKDGKSQAVDENGKNIQLVTTTGDKISVYDLSDKMSRKGFEASASGNLGKYFKYNVGYSYFKCSEEKSDTTMARYKITGMINFQKDRFGASVSLVNVPEYWHNNAKVGKYTLINANVSYLVTKDLKVSVFAKNLTDEKYATNYKGIGSGYLYDIGSVYGAEIKYHF